MAQKTEKRQINSLKIVGIGASAGGLAPIKELIGSLPDDIGDVAIVIAQHVSPDYKSMLVELIGRETSLTVKEVKNGLRIAKNTIYTTPSDNNIRVENGKFVLSKPTKAAAKPSIDLLFESIAKACSKYCAGVVLSGTGKDGSQGIIALKQQGGITIAQDPSTAKYESMPQAAIDTSAVDFILPPGIIGSELPHILSDPESYNVSDFNEGENKAAVMKVLGLLTDRIGTNLKSYKSSTINRRLQKRMHEKKIEGIDQYLEFLNQHPEELDTLFDSLLIGVTKFFRNPDSFEQITNVLNNILAQKEKGDLLRIWVPGCASGEEAYTFAILLHQLMGSGFDYIKVQIFATDIDQKALNKARKGVYELPAIENMSEELQQQYFVQRGNKYELISPVRKMVLFSKHDLTTNPPFLKLDLISCRNLLIYFNAALQSQIIPVFHYALNSDGYLFLGKSESIGQFKSLFSIEDFKHKIFQKKLSESSLNKFPYLKPMEVGRHSNSRKNVKSQNEPLTITQMVKETLYNSFEHPYVVVDENLELIEIHGEISEYLQLKTGAASMNILKLVIDDLQIEVRTVLGNTIRQSKTVVGNLRKISEDKGHANYIRLIGKPVIFSQHNNPLFLLIFEQLNLEKSFISSSHEIKESADDPRIMELDHELAATKEHMNTLVEELETSNEELQALNEELQSSNEELQASNEELETANEELEIANEEINLRKVEIEKQNETIRQSENNVKTLLNNTLQSFILLDKNYRLITFNKTAFNTFQKIFGKGLKREVSYIDYIPSTHFEDFQSSFRRALNGELVFLETQIQENVWLDFNFTPVLDDTVSEIEYISVSFMDRTQDKNTLIERNSLFTELQQRNNELEDINVYLENFVHAVAHDMRAPVANLKYLTDVFADADAAGQKEYLPIISSSVDKLDTTLRGLVQIIDIKGQQAGIDTEKIDISEVIEDILEEKKELIGETKAKIRIENHYPHKICYIRGYLEIILRNLLSNALKYRKEEEAPAIQIKVTQDNSYILISVKDNGIGMDLKKNQDNLFIPFKRFKQDIPGLGIGLHIIKIIIEKNGGKITVDSEVDKGSEFKVYLKEF